jgi:hypothetical protein
MVTTVTILIMVIVLKARVATIVTAVSIAISIVPQVASATRFPALTEVHSVRRILEGNTCLYVYASKQTVLLKVSAVFVCLEILQ